MTDGGASGLLVRPLTHELLDDWLAFFDRDAFADNPDWSDCYCQFFHVDDDAVWQARTGEQNRASAIDLINARQMHGYLAYLDGPAGGVVSRGSPVAVAAHRERPRIGSGRRRPGSARSCAFSSPPPRAGRAWPRRCSTPRAPGSATWDSRSLRPIRRAVAGGDAANYHGPLELYLRAGFERFGEAGDFVIVRRNLVGDAG